MALRFDLKPGERFYLNGAIIEANQRASILLHNKAAFLRCSEMMFESEVTTCARSVYFHTMKIALGEDEQDVHLADIMSVAAQMTRQHQDPEMIEILREILELLQSGRAYKALTRARALMLLETQRFPDAERSFTPPAPTAELKLVKA